MKLVSFLENKFQELTVLNQTQKDAYSISTDSEIKAIHEILSSYRTFLKWMLVPKLFFNFMLVNLKLQAEPEPVLLNKLKKEKKEQEDRQKLEEEKQMESNAVISQAVSASLEEQK